jgi:hypothetical protein
MLIFRQPFCRQLFYYMAAYRPVILKGAVDFAQGGGRVVSKTTFFCSN